MIELKPCPFCGKETAVFTNVQECELCSNFEDEDYCPQCYEPCGTDNCIHFVCCDVNKGGCGASTGWYLTKELAAEAWNRRANDGEWISVAEHGNPTEYTHAWVYTEDGAIDEDSFYPHDVGAEYSSNCFEGYRVSDGWYNSGTNDDGKRVIYYMPIPDPEPPAPPKGV